MNKYGFLSSVLFFILLFLPALPIGIYFGSESNPWLGINYYYQISLALLTHESSSVYLWGMSTSGSPLIWYQNHLLTFIFLVLIGTAGATIILIGSFKETETGKKLTRTGFIFQLIAFLYVIIGIPIYSNELIGVQFNYVDIFLFLQFGFYVFLLSTILSLIARIKHPIND